jgi:hypothetical protein
MNKETVHGKTNS